MVPPARQLVLGAATAPDGRMRALWRFVLGLLVVILANFAAGFVASGAGYGRRFELVFRPLALGFALAGFVLLARTADGREGDLASYLGLPRKRWLRDLFWGMLLGFGMVFVAVHTIYFVGDLTRNVYLNRRAFELAAVELVILAAGAAMEEVMFRGYPFQRLVESAGPVAATVVLSGLFGLAHLTNPNASIWGVANTAAVGVLFCLAYLRTRSLWMPIGIHFAWNTSLGLVFGLPVSGLRGFSVIVRSKAEGPLWLTGGAYGIEASAVGTVVISLGIAAVVFLVKERSKFVPVNAANLEGMETTDGNRAESIQT